MKFTLDDRRRFVEARRAYLRENYRNAEEVAVTYEVRFTTANNWWNGTQGPSGFAVAIDFILHPESAQRYLSNWREEPQ